MKDELYAYDTIRDFSVFTESFRSDDGDIIFQSSVYLGTECKYTTRVRMTFENCMRDVQLFISDFYKGD